MNQQVTARHTQVPHRPILCLHNHVYLLSIMGPLDAICTEYVPQRLHHAPNST